MKQFFILFFLIPFLLLGQDIRVSLELSQDEIRLDESLIVNLKLNYPAGYEVNPDILVTNLLERGNFSEPPFKLVDYKIEEKTTTSQTLSFTLNPQLAGYHPITFFDIPFINGKEQRVISPVKFVHVIHSPIDGNLRLPLAPLMTYDKHYPYHPTMEPTRKFLFPSNQANKALQLKAYKDVPWIETLVICLLVMLTIIFRNYKPVTTPQQRAAKATKHALNQLQKMRSKRLPTSAEYNTYFAGLADILREYLDTRYGIEAPALTTRELAVALNQKRLLDPHVQAELKELLIRADEIKFAGLSATDDECADAETTVRKLVEEYS